MPRVTLPSFFLLLLLVLAPRGVAAHWMPVAEMRVVQIADAVSAELRVDALPEPGLNAARWRTKVQREVASGVFVKADGVPIRCDVQVVTLGDPDGQGSTAAHRVLLDCPLPAASADVTVKATHRFGALNLELVDADAAQPTRHLLAPGDESPRLALVGLPRGAAAPWSGPSSDGADFAMAALGPDAASHVTPGFAETAGRYLVLGFEHIVPLGVDHVLFVLALFLLSPRLAPLLLQLTTFTLAHSLTLALVAMGVMSPPASVVEPLIAASIVFVGVENLRRRRLGPTRLAVVAAFGLLHGMGFAGVLHELGLPEGHSWLALAAFNVGVELGQIAVVLAALALTWRSRVDGEHPRWIRVPASGAIALMGLFWVVVRVFD